MIIAMMTSPYPDSTIPTPLLDAIVRQTGAAVTRIISRAGGGASRAGAQLQLDYPDGTVVQTYLSYDTRLQDPQRHDCFAREVAILQALSQLQAATPEPCSGQPAAVVRVARFITAVPDFLAIVAELAPGTDKLAAATDVQQVAGDFIDQLAALHRMDIGALPLATFEHPEQPPSFHIRARLQALRQENLSTVPDPLLQLALNWLEDHIPADEGPAVLVHGDAGAGNFMHANNRVTALLDWELCHYGDPMEDLAGIWVRSLFQPLLPMAEVLARYAQSSGRAVDVARVRYHRLYFQMGFTVAAFANTRGDFGGTPAQPGLHLLFGTVHLRVICQSLAELLGVPLQPPAALDCAAGGDDWFFQLALQDLQQVITPALADEQAQAKSKSLARLVKYWRAQARYGAADADAERLEIAQLLGQTFASRDQARHALALATQRREVDSRAVLQLCYNRLHRLTAMMADVLGSFNDIYFPPLDTDNHD